MPFAVTHMLVPIIIIDLIRDRLFKISKHKLPNKYILVAGLFGLLPDIDVPLSLITVGNLSAHRTLTHSIWLPVIFFIMGITFYLLNKRKWFLISLMCAIGVLSHILLDMMLWGTVQLFYPLNSVKYGLSIFPLNLVNLGESGKSILFFSSLDAIIIWIWFFRMEFKKRIQDFL